MILELKISETFKGMESKCREALEQIENQKYAVPLKDGGYQEILTRREQEIPHFYKDATEKVVVKSYI